MSQIFFLHPVRLKESVEGEVFSSSLEIHTISIERSSIGALHLKIPFLVMPVKRLCIMLSVGRLTVNFSSIN